MTAEATSGGAVLITGGTSGIGLGIAVHAARHGRPVVVAGRDETRCAAAREAVVDASGADPARVLAVPADTTVPEDVARAVALGTDTFGVVDGLVTAAGRLARGSLTTLTDADFRAALEVNVLGTWTAIRAVVPGMLAHGGGRVVTIGSVLGSTGAPERSGYAASKAAIEALTRSLALELATTGVTVNCVAPGPVRTPMNTAAPEDAAAQAAFTAKVPQGRWGTPADIAHMVWALLAPGAAFVTGSVVTVDGGYTAQ